MINLQRNIRDSSNKSRTKSIYTGNKSHTTSMNLKVSQELPVPHESSYMPLRDIMNKNDNRNYR